MKMLTIVCREKFEVDVLVLFSNVGVTGYTVMSGAGGSGETGEVSGKRGWRDCNMLFLVALNDDQVAPLVTAMKELRVRLMEEHFGIEVPLKAFLQPCELVL